MNTSDIQSQQADAPTATISDLRGYGAALQEVVQAASFIADTATLIEGHNEWDGTAGNPSPYYLTQLVQLVRQAANKQLSVLEIMEGLVSEPVPNDVPLLDVMALPQSHSGAN